MTIGNTELEPTKQDLITGIVQEELARRAVIAPSIMDLSGRVGPGMKSVSLHDAGSFTAASKAENTDLSVQTISFTNDTLNLDQHKAVYTEVEDKDELQSMVDLEMEIASRMSSAIVTAFDDYLYEQLKLASASAPDHRIAYANDPTNTIQAVDILEARRLLNVQEVQQENRFLLIPPTQEKAMLQIADFVQADRYGSSDAIQNGELGRIYGFKVLVSNAAESDNYCIAYHSDAVGFAWQRSVRFRSDIRLKGVSREYAMDAIWGAKVLQSGVRQVLIGSAV